ncbi:NAC domain-containing protein 72-like [Nymphaea colorata]|nr:NAC domain-containing protein 72-like [Nymphaea colorata]
MEGVAEQMYLPPGFRFHPSDEELLLHYLLPKTLGMAFSDNVIADINLYKYDPWVLPGKALLIDSENEWHFFTQRDRKYPNGSRPNRGAGSGFWKATGTDKTITSGGRKVGVKKSLVFYIGKPPNGSKTNWIMHEYRVLLDGENSSFPKNKEPIIMDNWFLCRIYKKNQNSLRRPTRPHSEEDVEATPSFNGCMSSSILCADHQLAGGSLFERDTSYQRQEFPDTSAFDLSDIVCREMPTYLPNSSLISTTDDGGEKMNTTVEAATTIIHPVLSSLVQAQWARFHKHKSRQ